MKGGDGEADFRIADQKAGISEAYRRDHGLTWHHNEDLKTMELLPKELHTPGVAGGMSHSGGSAIINANSSASVLKELVTAVATAVAPATLRAMEKNAGAKETAKAAYQDANAAAIDAVGGVPKMAIDVVGEGWLSFLDDCDKPQPKQ